MEKKYDSIREFFSIIDMPSAVAHCIIEDIPFGVGPLDIERIRGFVVDYLRVYIPSIYRLRIRLFCAIINDFAVRWREQIIDTDEFQELKMKIINEYKEAHNKRAESEVNEIIRNYPIN